MIIKPITGLTEAFAKWLGARRVPFDAGGYIEKCTVGETILIHAVGGAWLYWPIIPAETQQERKHNDPKSA